VRAFIVGDGEEMQRIIQLTANLDIPFATPGSKTNQPLTFTSWLTNIDEVMAGMDIVAMTSFNEGTPVSLIEAQASNKAIVTTAVGGIEDVVIPGKTALLSPNDQIAPFAENLLQLIENDTLRATFGKQGYEFVKEKFSFSRLVNDMGALYQKLLTVKR
jgi:glycosyltransferase involved in cell wall biosynthesis